MSSAWGGMFRVVKRETLSGFIEYVVQSRGEIFGEWNDIHFFKELNMAFEKAETLYKYYQATHYKPDEVIYE